MNDPGGMGKGANLGDRNSCGPAGLAGCGLSGLPRHHHGFVNPLVQFLAMPKNSNSKWTTYDDKRLIEL